MIANAIASGYLVLSLPFSIICIVRPHLRGLRILLIILDTVSLSLDHYDHIQYNPHSFVVVVYFYIYISIWPIDNIVHILQLMIGLAMAAAASAATIADLAQNGNSNANWAPICQQFDDFCQSITEAVQSSFAVAVIFILLVVFSSLALRRN